MGVKTAYAASDPCRRAENDLAFDWESYTPPVAHRLGVQTVEASIETLRNYIDWTPFFMTGRWRVNIRAFWKMKW